MRAELARLIVAMLLRSRSRTLQRASLLVTAVVVTACGSSPAAPTPAAGYAGLWSGTTAQGTPVTFTISTEENVTTISVAHNFNGCSGSQTFSNLSLPIKPETICVPGPCSASQQAYRQLAYSSGGSADGPMFGIVGVFLPIDRVEGTVNFRNYPGCGSAMSVPWSATRR